MEPSKDLRGILLRLAVAVNTATSIEQILDAVMGSIRHILPHDGAVVALVDEGGEHLERQDIVSAGSSPTVAETEGPIPLDETNALGWVLLHRKPHLRRTLDEATEFVPQQKGRQFASHIIAPMVAREEDVGVLTIGSYTPGRFDEKDVEIYTHYANLTAVAIHNLRNYERARELSIRDALTGVFNRHHLQEILDVEVARSRRSGVPTSLLLIDVDHFKEFNDRFGHQVGDRILRATAACFQRSLRLTDQVFRYGGDEFAVLLPVTGSFGARDVATKLREVVRDDTSLRLPRPGSRPTLSIGAGTVPQDGATSEDLIAAADAALYRAKRNGRDQIVVSLLRPESARSRRNGHSALAALRPVGARA
jgi:diguanylate cyclase (GGDEF)-like protein